MMATLELYKNKLTGHIPDALESLLEMVVFDANENRFSCPIPHALGSMLKMQTLVLSENLLRGRALSCPLASLK